jgi:hypothetical protein
MPRPDAGHLAFLYRLPKKNDLFLLKSDLIYQMQHPIRRRHDRQTLNVRMVPSYGSPEWKNRERWEDERERERLLLFCFMGGVKVWWDLICCLYFYLFIYSFSFYRFCSLSLSFLPLSRGLWYGEVKTEEKGVVTLTLARYTRREETGRVGLKDLSS